MLCRFANVIIDEITAWPWQPESRKITMGGRDRDGESIIGLGDQARKGNHRREGRCTQRSASVAGRTIPSLGRAAISAENGRLRAQIPRASRMTARFGRTFDERSEGFAQVVIDGTGGRAELAPMQGEGLTARAELTSRSGDSSA